MPCFTSFSPPGCHEASVAQYLRPLDTVQRRALRGLVTVVTVVDVCGFELVTGSYRRRVGSACTADFNDVAELGWVRSDHGYGRGSARTADLTGVAELG